jgi:hypothetical protein
MGRRALPPVPYPSRMISGVDVDAKILLGIGAVDREARKAKRA